MSASAALKCMAASPGKALFGTVLLCAVSVVKADHVRRSRYKLCTKTTNGPFWQINFRLSVSFEEMILSRLKSSILVVLCKSNCRWSLFRKKLCILAWLV